MSECCYLSVYLNLVLLYSILYVLYLSSRFPHTIAHVYHNSYFIFHIQWPDSLHIRPTDLTLYKKFIVKKLALYIVDI